MTLVEVLIAISLFTLAAVISTNLLVEIVKLEKKTSVENAVYEDVRIILQQLTAEIQNGTIDYDEYFSVCVIQDGCKAGIVDGVEYGVYHGVYGSRFYDPGKRSDGVPAVNPRDLGVECSFPDPLGAQECEITYALSGDLNTGQNPFAGSDDADQASAFCEEGKGICDNANAKTVTVDNQLFLINGSGTTKTILGRKLIKNNDYALGKIILDGEDSDQNGLMDKFECSEEYSCDTPKQDDLADAFVAATTEFVPITPLRTSVTKLQFIISPVEDPYKAYAEDEVRFHPSVTILLTLDLSAEFEEIYPGDFQEFTVQTTVSAGLTDRIESYPPKGDIYAPGGKSWIDDIAGIVDRQK